MTPAALRAETWPTMPSETARGSKEESRPRPRMCECAPTRSMRVRSRVSESFSSVMVVAAMEMERAEFLGTKGFRVESVCALSTTGVLLVLKYWYNV